jgi:hypothetical protein
MVGSELRRLSSQICVSAYIRALHHLGLDERRGRHLPAFAVTGGLRIVAGAALIATAGTIETIGNISRVWR